MDALRFDRLTSALAVPSRRGLLHGLAAAWGLATIAPVEARKKNRKKKRKKAKFNEFGCVNVGGFCKNDEQCCSGICQGKKGKKKCKPHDQSTCQAGQQEQICGGVTVLCTGSAGEGGGACDTTTGNAPFCTIDGECFPCTKDADCIPFCGSTAACIVCGPECPQTGGTACVSSIDNACTFLS